MNSENLKKIVKNFKKYIKKAIKCPVGSRKTKIAIEADFNQYYPSEEAILASVLGKMIEKIVNSHFREEFEKNKVQKRIKSLKLNLTKFTLDMLML